MVYYPGGVRQPGAHGDNYSFPAGRDCDCLAGHSDGWAT
jgi:hypothetical protein